MNYARNQEIEDNVNVGVSAKGGPSVPLPSIMASVSRVTRDSAPEEAAQNQLDSTETASTEQDVHRDALNVTDSAIHESNAFQSSASASASMSVTLPSVPSEQIPSSTQKGSHSNWNVKDDWHRRVPSFYPLEKSSRYVNNTPPSVVSGRISDCCRLLSVQAQFDDTAGTASLTTAEHVEIHLSLWSGGGKEEPEYIIVEAQRRTGCPIKYHEYIRHLLDAAQGRFDGEKIELNKIKPGVIDRKEKGSSKSNDEKSLSAVEIAAKLLKKDRLDAQRLGMESLCFLTDPSRTGVETALVASRAVLFGSVNNDNEEDVEFLADELGVREAVLSLVQFGRLNDSAGCAIDSDSDEESAKVNDEDKNFNDILHNLALAVLSNALEVLEKYEVNFSSSSEVERSQVTNDFLKESEEISQRELIDSLLNVLGQAEAKPHDACLSAQCLRSLLQASRKARRKARDMNAKQIVATALEVGTRTHVKLQTETLNVLRELEKPDDEVQEDDN